MDPSASSSSAADQVVRRAAVIARHLRDHAGGTPSASPLLVPAACLRYSPPEVSEKAAFDSREMRRLMDGHDLEARDWLFRVMEENRLFCPRRRGGEKTFVAPDYNQSKEQQREATMRRIEYLLGRGVFEGWLTVRGPEAEMRKFAFFECVGIYDHSLVIKLGVQFFLWGGAIQFLGTKRHHDKWLKDTENLVVKGCFAMTELGHGSNVRGIETIATYDSNTQEFVINTPCESAQKYWIGGAAKHATHAIIFSQLHINGTSQGVHAFIAQIRDADGNIHPSIRIADCGHKIGLNGVDNGRIWFDNLRVPRENLLNSVADVLPDGQYVSSIKDPDQRFAAFLAPLTSGRINIAVSSVYMSKVGLAIAVRYALTRRAFSISPNGPEVLLLDYPSHQRRLLPLIAKTCAMSCAANFLKSMYVRRTPEAIKTIHIYSSALKATLTWQNMRTLQECREACGGQGLKTESRIGILKGEYDVQSTFEGDNSVLMQQVSKALLGEYIAVQKRKKPFKGLGLEKRLVAGDSVLFIWNEKNQLLLGIRRASRPQTVMPSSVLSSDSMHIGLLAAAAHAAATNSRFTIFYNPRASPSEFVIPLSKYVKAVFHTRISVGMRFRMLFETEESSVRRYMGTITEISDLDPVRWPNSHWRSVKVGWDESTAGERPPRVSLWEIEPLTTFPMYPSMFPLRLKRPWYPGVPSFHDEANALMWLRGGAGDRGLPSLNFQSPGVGPWVQQRMESTLLGHDHDQYPAMAAPALPDTRGSDYLKQQFLHLQQPYQLPQQFCSTSPLLQQQIIQQACEQQIIGPQSQNISGNLTHDVLHQQLQQSVNNQKQVQHTQTYPESYQIPGTHVQQQQAPLPSQLCEKLDFSDSGVNFSTVMTSSSIQGMLGTAYPEGSSNVLDFARLGQSMMGGQNPQTWEPKFTMSQSTTFGNAVLLPPFPGKDGSVGTENGSTDMQNHTLFGVNIDSSSLLSHAVPSLRANSIDNNISTMPYASSSLQNSIYGSLEESSGVLQNAGEADPTNKTFVKVYKSGSVGRSLDITRFNNYGELREELGQMFGIKGQLEDPLRSGWQLVFVDRENDVLLLGDDPWESFVNNVWYIKILSPEDVQKMGKRAIEPC